MTAEPPLGQNHIAALVTAHTDYDCKWRRCVCFYSFLYSESRVIIKLLLGFLSLKELYTKPFSAASGTANITDITGPSTFCGQRQATK